MSVLDVTGIRGLLLVGNKRFEQHQPARTDRRQSPVERGGRLGHKRCSWAHVHHCSSGRSLSTSSVRFSGYLPLAETLSGLAQPARSDRAAAHSQWRSLTCDRACADVCVTLDLHLGSYVGPFKKDYYPPAGESWLDRLQMQAEKGRADPSKLCALRAARPLSLGRVCKSCLMDNAPSLEIKRMMRLRPKVKALLPKIAEAIIAIEIHSLERQ